jgi:hypothetical protein
LPAPVQRYFKRCGFVGTEATMIAGDLTMRNVDFAMDGGRRRFTMSYEQHNFVDGCTRLAYMRASIAGLPFEGLDTYCMGHGRMTGMLGKVATLFDTSGPQMDASELVTWLGEMLVLVPSAAFEPYITWVPIDEDHAHAELTYNGTTVGGIFTFDAAGNVSSFSTNDRYETQSDGSLVREPWLMEFSGWHQTAGDSFWQPGHCRITWEYGDGRTPFTYFEGDVEKLTWEL